MSYECPCGQHFRSGAEYAEHQHRCPSFQAWRQQKAIETREAALSDNAGACRPLAALPSTQEKP